MSATGYLESALTKHMVYLQRYGAGINNDQKELFTTLASSVRSTISERLTSFSRARINATIAQIDALIDEIFDVYDVNVQSSLKELAEYESTFQYNAMQQVVNTALVSVPVERLEAILSDSKMTLISGKKEKVFTLDGLLEDFRNATKAKSAKDIRDTIAAGIASGDNADTIARRVATKVGNEIGLPKSTIQTWSKTNVLTSVNHVSQQARNELANANKEYIDKEKWSSTLDIKTSLICIGRDSNIYDVGEGPFPPAHHRCRSLRLPYIDPKYAIVKESTRASAFGPVDSRTTYNSWLKKQSPDFQNDVLGEDRAELFRAGKADVRNFTDDSGKVYTLAELKEKEGITLE